MTIKRHEHVDLPTPSGPMRTFIFRPTAAGNIRALVLFSKFSSDWPDPSHGGTAGGHGFGCGAGDLSRVPRGHGAAPTIRQVLTKENELKTTKELASYDADARAVLTYLKSHPACTGKLGAIGICIGGHLSFARR